MKVMSVTIVHDSHPEQADLLLFGHISRDRKAILTIRAFMLKAVRMFLERFDNMSRHRRQSVG